MPPRKRARSTKRGAMDETQRIPMDDLELATSVPARAPIAPVDSDITPDRRTTRQRGANAETSGASANGAGLSRSTRRLAAMLVAQNPPTLPQSTMLGALSFSDASGSDVNRTESDLDDDVDIDHGDAGRKGNRMRGVEAEDAMRTSPPRSRKGRLEVGDDSPVSRLTSSRHTVSLSKTMKRFAAVPHHLATTSAFVGRAFKAPSSTAPRTAAAPSSSATVTRLGEAGAVMPFIDTQLPDAPVEVKTTRARVTKTISPTATATADPSMSRPTTALEPAGPSHASSCSSLSSHVAPACTDGTDPALLSDSQETTVTVMTTTATTTAAGAGGGGGGDSGSGRAEADPPPPPPSTTAVVRAPTATASNEEVLAGSLDSPSAVSAGVAGKGLSRKTGAMPLHDVADVDDNDHNALTGRAMTLLGAAESLPDEDGRELSEPGMLAAGEVLLDSLGGPGQGRLTQAEEDHARAAASAPEESGTFSSTTSTPRLMVTPQPPHVLGSHLLGGGSVGTLSPLSMPRPRAGRPPTSRRSRAHAGAHGVSAPTADGRWPDDAEPAKEGTPKGRRGRQELPVEDEDAHDDEDEDVTPYTATDDFAQTLAVHDLSLRSGAAAGLFDSLPPEDLLMTALSSRTGHSPPIGNAHQVRPHLSAHGHDMPPARAEARAKEPATAVHAAAPAVPVAAPPPSAHAPLPETVDDGCDKSQPAVREDDVDEEAEAGLAHNGLLGHTSEVRRLGTEANHAKLVASARQAGAARTTVAVDPFLGSLPSASLSAASGSTVPTTTAKSEPVPSPARPRFTVGTTVEARWGRNWYPAIVSEDERGGYVQIRWADEDEDSVLHLKTREVRLPKVAGQGKPTGASEAVVVGPPKKVVSTARVSSSAVTASQLAELMELELVPADTAALSRKRAREETHSCTPPSLPVPDAGSRAEAPTMRPLGVHGSHLVLFSSRTSAASSTASKHEREATQNSALFSATIVEDFETFERLAARIGELYHAMDTAESSDTDNAHEASSATTTTAAAAAAAAVAPPLCVYLVDSDCAAMAAVPGEEGPQDAASPAASWEVLIAHALGLAAVRAGWRTRVESEETDSAAAALCPLPHDTELLHVLRHYTSPRPSTRPTRDGVATADKATNGALLEAEEGRHTRPLTAASSTTTATAAASAPGCFFPWRASSRFLYGARVYMAATAQRWDPLDPMARLIRAVGGEPVPVSSPHVAHASASTDFVYFPPGTDTASLHAALCATTPALKDVPLLELPWLVKNIEAQFARRARTVPHWWHTRAFAGLSDATTVSAASAQPDRLLLPWSVARPSPISLVKPESDDDEEAEAKETRAAATDGAPLVPPGQAPRELSRPPPLAPKTASTTPARPAARDGSRHTTTSHSSGGGISPTTIAAIKARGRRGLDKTSPASSGRATAQPLDGKPLEMVEEANNRREPHQQDQEEEEQSGARRALSYPVESGVEPPVADAITDDSPFPEAVSPFMGFDCPHHPPVNEGEDYYYRVPLAMPARLSTAASSAGATAGLSSSAPSAVAHELGLGRVSGVDHHVAHVEVPEASADGEAVPRCHVHLQLYTVRRVVMRQNPLTFELEQQTTVALSRRCVTVPSSALLFEVPVYVVNAAALRHVYVLEDDEGYDEDERVEYDNSQSVGAVSPYGRRRQGGAGVTSQAPMATAVISPPRPTVRLEPATTHEFLPRRML